MNFILRKILYTVPWIFPDRKFIELIWENHWGKKIDLDHPVTFNEKIQWQKIYDRKRLYTELVDKAAVKDIVAREIGVEHIIPNLGVWKKFDDIDFDSLPDSFVLKCTHDSGSVIIVRDKKTFDRDEARRKLDSALRRNFYLLVREWPYKNVPRRIIAEPYLAELNSSLDDYKFFCFNGVPKFLYISHGLEDHATASISFADMDGVRMPFRRSDFKDVPDPLPIPDNFPQMKEIAAKLARLAGSRFIRVDLYSIKGKIYFSEFTFSPNGGFLPFEPDEWDKKLGDMFIL